MRKVLVTGGAGELGTRVVSLLAQADFCSEVVALDREEGPPISGVRRIRGDLTSLSPGTVTDDLLAGVDTVVHLGWVDPDEEGGDPNRSLLEAVLELATAPEIGQLVVISSATVYGAWENNPVPLSENSVVRPNPGFAYAETKAEHERVLAEWRRGAGAGTAVSVLRPAPAVGTTGASWLGAALLAAVPVRVDRTDPPSQFLDVGDLATAVVRVVELGLDGPYNVAPDGWLTGDELRALLGPRARLRIPAPIARPVHRLLRRRRSRPLPEGLLPYTMYPWVVSNDRLESAGWTPTVGNDEAFVEVDQAPPWVSLNARQRQYLSLGALGALVTGLLGWGIWMYRRRRRAVPS